MIDPTLTLALALYESPGVFAVLLGSGVSSAARIPTGWQVTLDLLGKLSGTHPDDEAQLREWWRDRTGGEPDYAAVLAEIGPTPATRRLLLHRYFEPTDDEAEAGVKVPTAAHRALARLVSAGVIRVVVTTNFDRLLEMALSEVGVVPQVISTPSAAAGRTPLRHTPCTVLKVHGDYLDEHIRNTTDELATYEPVMDELLDEIMDEYGLVVCGWSGAYDRALPSAITRSPGRRYPTFVSTRGEPTAELVRLIGARSARVITGRTADELFVELEGFVEGLRGRGGPHPRGAAAVVAALERYVAEPRWRIEARHLVLREAEGLLAMIATIAPADGPIVTAPAFQEAITDLEVASASCIGAMVTGCAFDNVDPALWVDLLERLANPAAPVRGQRYVDVWVRLQRYPALLALYAGGLAALGASRLELLASLLTVPARQLTQGSDPGAPFGALAIWHDVLDNDRQLREALGVPPMETLQRSLGSRLVARAIRGQFALAVPSDHRFDALFDRFEQLLALLQTDVWVRANSYPRSAFMRFQEGIAASGRPNPANARLRDAVAEGRWDWTLRIGLFEGNRLTLLAAADALAAQE